MFIVISNNLESSFVSFYIKSPKNSDYYTINHSYKLILNLKQ